MLIGLICGKLVGGGGKIGESKCTAGNGGGGNTAGSNVSGEGGSILAGNVGGPTGGAGNHIAGCVGKGCIAPRFCVDRIGPCVAGFVLEASSTRAEATFALLRVLISSRGQRWQKPQSSEFWHP